MSLLVATLLLQPQRSGPARQQRLGSNCWLDVCLLHLCRAAAASSAATAAATADQRFKPLGPQPQLHAASQLQRRGAAGLVQARLEVSVHLQRLRMHKGVGGLAGGLVSLQSCRCGAVGACGGVREARNRDGISSSAAMPGVKQQQRLQCTRQAESAAGLPAWPFEKNEQLTYSPPQL